MGEGTHICRTITSFELIFIERGRLQMFEEHRRFDLHAGQCLLLWPGRQHGGTARYEKGLSFYWVHFTQETQPRKMRLEEDDELAFTLPQSTTPGRPDYLTELYRRFLDDRERGIISPVRGSLLVMQILLEASLCNLQAETSETAASLAGHIQAFIDEHNDQPISTSDIAAAMGYNEDYLGRVFRQVQQMTITEAIHRSQIRLAKALLQTHHMNINQVAQRCGYNDPRYFRRLFRRYEGLTPSAYRRLHARAFINRY